jgi:hypothetical protein
MTGANNDRVSARRRRGDGDGDATTAARHASEIEPEGWS